MSFELFVGTFEHTLDDKGRIVLPAKFRSHFADGGYLSPGEGFISLRTSSQFEDMFEDMKEARRGVESKGETSRALADRARAFGAGSVAFQPDAHGRVTLSAQLQKEFALDREVVLVGAFDFLQIYSPSAWRAVESENAAALAEAFSQGFGI